jgi:pyridoxal phosphate enzyme (YggS family)
VTREPDRTKSSVHSILERNIRAVRDRIARAAEAAGRAPDEVELLAVTKSVPPGPALALARAGQRELGENRLEPLAAKRAAFDEAGIEARWHWIGPVQRNKARRILAVAHVIHSVDRASLVDALERIAGEEDLRPDVYLQVNVSGEDVKGGAAPADVPELAARAAAAEHLGLVGLMAMAPRRTGDDDADARAARTTFDTLAELSRALPPELFTGGRPRLSIGMSADLEQAVAAGSDVVRVGTALFEGLPAELLGPGPGGPLR